VKVLGARSEIRLFGTKSERIEQIARVQRGRVSRTQLLAVAIKRKAIARRVATGYLIQLHRCVFAVGHLAPTSLGDETAALLACREGAVLSHYTAARIWGILPPGSGDGLIHITVEGERTTRIPNTTVHRTRDLQPRDIRIHERLPLTSPARTVLDLAPLLTLRELERALDQALINHLTSPSQIRELLDCAPGRAGTIRLKALATRATTTRTRSEAEERFLALIRAAELPHPEVNAPLHDYEIDFLWRDRRFAVEIDGYAYHSTRTAFEHDRRKDAHLQAAGFTTMRVTWMQLEHDRFPLVARLGRALGAGDSA
jgi:very-short-patch-repair endonuclease